MGENLELQCAELVASTKILVDLIYVGLQGDSEDHGVLIYLILQFDEEL
jgi:hypothetical protein